MIRLADKLWVGESSDVKHAFTSIITGVLNVAHDLVGEVGWPNAEYMQAGLVDGPGNPPIAYCTAILALATLIRRHEVLVYCHTGSRAVAVALMYLSAASGKYDWDDMATILEERIDITLPTPHEAHRKAFNKINWLALKGLVEVNEEDHSGDPTLAQLAVVADVHRVIDA